MISQESAKIAADELVAQARATSIQDRNARAQHQHPLYRFPELQTVQPWQRTDVLRQCMAKADRQWSVVAACFVWLACTAGAWIFMPTLSAYGVRAAIGIAFTFGLPFVLIRRAQVQHHLLELVRTLPQPAPQDNGPHH